MQEEKGKEKGKEKGRESVREEGSKPAREEGRHVLLMASQLFSNTNRFKCVLTNQQLPANMKLANTSLSLLSLLSSTGLQTDLHHWASFKIAQNLDSIFHISNGTFLEKKTVTTTNNGSTSTYCSVPKQCKHPCCDLFQLQQPSSP